MEKNAKTPCEKKLMNLYTWILVLFPSGVSLINCKWDFHIKFITNGDLDKYKAKLVAISFFFASF